MKPHFYTSKARKIGITKRSVSGSVPDIGAYESSLERDFMEIARFDPAVIEVVPQPITISYQAIDCKTWPYTPDGLVRYKPELDISPLLYEIKYLQDFKDSWKELYPKLRAAKKLATSRGWRFHVLTEREIRTPYLNNIRFLWQFKNKAFEQNMTDHVLGILRDLQEADVDLLLASLFSDRSNQARVIPVIWHLVATHRIGCDLDAPLTMNTLLYNKDDVL